MNTPREHARHVFEKQLREIEQSGVVQPFMYIADTRPKGNSIFIAIDGPIMNSREEKAALGRRVREIIADIEADLVLFISDTFFCGNQRPEARRDSPAHAVER